MYLAQFIGLTRMIEYPLCDGSFTGIDMGNDTYIADILKREFPGHFFISRWLTIIISDVSYQILYHL